MNAVPRRGCWHVDGFGVIAIDPLKQSVAANNLIPIEREMLIALIQRIDGAPTSVRRALGIRARRSKHDARNEAIADLYVELTDVKRKAPKAALGLVLKRFPQGARAVVENASELGRARVRLWLAGKFPELSSELVPSKK